MGCDIHCYKEKLVHEKWVSADTWTDSGWGLRPSPEAYEGRNYELFGLLAGVRNRSEHSLEPKGLPPDVSEPVQAEWKSWGGDGHSHSWLSLTELKELRKLCDANTVNISGMKDREELAALRASIDSGEPNWDLLYPYCQWTNDINSEQFSIDAPMAFNVGKCLDQMIAAFDGIEGDDHRLVFWFDN